MDKLRIKYLPDFLLFDYDDRPSELFTRDAEDKSIKQEFDYFDVLEVNTWSAKVISCIL